MQNNSRVGTLLLFIAGVLQGCNWVDSGGSSAVTNTTDPGIRIPVIDYQPSAQSLRDEKPAALLENAATRVLFEDSATTAGSWRWQLIEQGNDLACEGVEGFDTRYSSDSLEQACASASQCDLSITQNPNSTRPQFNIALPVLTSPVALTYRVSSGLDDGSLVTREQIICALAINEAPSAGDDHYRVLVGSERTVEASGPDNLLVNDIDDLDVRNEPLSINTLPVIAPQFADVFSLQSEGGFTYRAKPDTPLDNGTQTDSFTYSVSDGLHEVTATVTISIVASNAPPLPIADLPDVRIDLSSGMSDALYGIDVSAYFTDADDDTLYYNIDTSDLPEDLLISIDGDGQLNISRPASEIDQLPGEWLIDVIVSDGLARTNAAFQLTLVDSEQQTDNRAPTVSDIRNNVVRDTFRYDISQFFRDPDGDELTFSSQSLPPAVSLSASGILSGTSSSQNSGNWLIVVTASDAWGESVSDAFRLVINQ